MKLTNIDFEMKSWLEIFASQATKIIMRLIFGDPTIAPGEGKVEVEREVGHEEGSLSKHEEG